MLLSRTDHCGYAQCVVNYFMFSSCVVLMCFYVVIIVCILSCTDIRNMPSIILFMSVSVLLIEIGMLCLHVGLCVSYFLGTKYNYRLFMLTQVILNTPQTLLVQLKLDHEFSFLFVGKRIPFPRRL